MNLMIYFVQIIDIETVFIFKKQNKVFGFSWKVVKIDMQNFCDDDEM